MREEFSWIVENGKWKQIREFVDVANPEGRMIRKEEKLPPEMENISATIKQTLEQMGLKIQPGPAGAFSTVVTDEQFSQLSNQLGKQVGIISEPRSNGRHVSIYPVMIPEQKEESRNDVPSLNSPGYLTTAEKASQVKKADASNIQKVLGKEEAGAQSAEQLAQGATELSTNLQAGNLADSQSKISELEQLIQQIKQSVEQSQQAVGAKQ